MKSYLFCLIVLTLASTAFAQGRVTLSFDNDWRFAKGEQNGAETPQFKDGGWRKLNVPHDWSIEGPFDAKNPTTGSGGYLPSGVGWYRKHFAVSANDKGKNFFVEFDGVMANSVVWINGTQVCSRPNGYVSFVCDLSPAIDFTKENVLAVRVDTSKQPASRWYTGAGIYRHVRLVIKSPLSIQPGGLFVSTPSVSSAGSRVLVTAVVGGAVRTEFSLQVTIYDPDGKEIETKASRTWWAGSQPLAMEFTIKNPNRWDISNPVLYKAVVLVRDANNRVVDSETVTFGIREIQFIPATGFWLNRKNLKIKGACLHHDGSAFGAAVPLAVWEYRLNELRKLGVNAIRTAHNPPSPEFLDLTDRMGFLVMDELFDQWTLPKNPYDYHKDFDQWATTDVADTVRRDRNHPSVILYSAGNEIRDNHGDPEKAKQTLKKLVDAFHELDRTRPVTQALFRPNIEGANDYNNGLADILDVVGQNYREKEILAAYKQKPTRKILGTENTHDLNQWLALRDNPEYSGQFIWVGIDYLGESAAWPNYAYGKGLLDRTALRRPVGYQRQSWWSSSPMVYMARRVAPAQASPTDPGYEVAEQRRTQTLFGDWTPKNLAAHEENVEVYSNCDEVELFLNGRSLGSKPKPADDSPRNWKVGFETGTLKAVGMNGGKPVAEFDLRTVGKPVSILLSTVKQRVANEWNDVVVVTATVIDEHATVVPSSNNMIDFKISGPGVIAAVDSGDNADHDPFQTTRRKAFQGRCVAYVKASKDSGTITVTARSGALKSNTVRLSVNK